MSELLLEALMQIFALLTDQREEQETGQGVVEVKNFLSRNLNSEFVDQAIERYDFYVEKYHENSYSKDQAKREKQVSSNMHLLKTICDQLNQELEQSTKFLLVTNMLNFIMRDEHVSDEEGLFTDALAVHLKLEEDEYKNLRDFIVGYPLDVESKDRLLLISGQQEKPEEDIKHIYNPKQQIFVWVLHIKATNQFVFRYSGSRNLYLNGHIIEQNRAAALSPGSVIKTSRISPVYYGTISEKFIARPDRARIVYRAIDIEYKFNSSTIGIHPFSFTGRSGQLVSIMGGSGTGKSTLLNVLNGNLKLDNGQITINGYDVNSEDESLQGVIGYVPQDDLLKEELTVFENLYYNARLCFSHLSKEEINELVEKGLHDFDLVEARDLVVGSPLNKILSGGQRKRLNIALELIREPSILFVDEPTSGLSSMDSEKVMVLLKRQTLKGRLVIINIHQPSSDLYKLIDKLLIIDKGGRIIYNGNPTDAITYFKKMANYVNPDESECYICGNVQTEQPLRIIESRMVNPYGKFIRQRKVSPEEWYDHYIEKFESKFEWKQKGQNQKKERLPHNLYNIPGRLEQFKIYFQRDFLSKIKNKQYILINMLEAPILALILGFFTKFISGDGGNESTYVFSNNVNLPAYLFMSVVVSLFLGLTVSAEEIFKDKRLLQRESFLNLSRSSFLNAKVVIMFIISAIQTLSFVLIGNYILEVQGLTLSYWLILLSTACFANMIGLNISSGLNSVVTIYILIPLILVPQLLFSGVIVGFDKLHRTIASEEYVPRIGDCMTSRWSYEALAVNQFCNNKYERLFFDVEKRISTSSYKSTLLIPELITLNKVCKKLRSQGETEELQSQSQLLINEIQKLLDVKTTHYPALSFFLSGRANFSEDTYNRLDKFLKTERVVQQTEYREAKKEKDQLFSQLINEFGSKEAFLEFKKTYQNEAIEELVLNKRELQQIETSSNSIIQKKHPIFKDPVSHLGRAHFYSPSKNVLGLSIPTALFNTLIIWLWIAFFYITLYFDVLRKIIRYFETFKLRRLNKRLQSIRP
ncbi:ATP-binding cassette domain-containing protein [Carboxylicivirga sp. N1Y90]|uniref:ATP-binding cassette domain-containing protein n=1 Tax=Carboxylicivirga fragile TaxID=3417571 RepID=UPI003D33FB6A|nr:ATP-binding cassette domain-containing protein [Marinilabiliaceae bacterium N1Y90]